MNVTHFAKAIVGGLIAGLSAAVPLVDDGVSLSDVLLIALATLLGLGGVYVVPNKDPQAAHQAESVQPPGA